MTKYTIKTSRETFENCRLELGQYTTGNLAIEIYCDDDYFTTLTVNLPEERKLSDGEAFVDINNNPWALDFIAENKLGENTGSVGFSGMCMYPLVRFNLQKLAE